MSEKLNRSKRLKNHHRNKKREQYLRSIQKKLWNGEDMPNLPVEAVADLATELFSTSCGARKLAGLHLPEAVRESCKGRISPCSLVLALLYLERLKTGGVIAADYLSDVTPSELFIVSMMIANKFLQDEGDSNEVENWFWSELSGFETDHINTLEKNFLSAIQWEVFVSQAEFWKRMHSLHRTVSLRQGTRRGWFTYEETSALLAAVPLSNFFNTIFQVSAACLASYTAAFVTLIAATMLSAQLQRCLLLTSILDSGRSIMIAPSTMCPPIPESWHVILPEFSGLPSWQQVEENGTENINGNEIIHHYLNASFVNSTPAQKLDDTWQQIISYLTSATIHTKALPQSKQEIPLIQLKGVI